MAYFLGLSLIVSSLYYRLETAGESKLIHRIAIEQEIGNMYQPALRPDQVKALYYLKRKLSRPMTELVRDAVDDYLKLFGGPEKILPLAERNERQTSAEAK